MSASDPLVLSRLAPPTARVTPRKSQEPKGLRFGEKVRILLARNAEEEVEPSTPKALADAIHVDNPKVYRAMKSHEPKLGLARKIARALGESLDFLCDPERGIEDRAPGDRWESFVSGLSPTERDAIAGALSRSPDVRRLLLAYADRARSGPTGQPPTPTGPRT